MIEEFSSPGMTFNEATSSHSCDHSRKSAFDDDAFFSPSKAKSELRSGLHILSPQQAKLPTIHDKILDWFRGLISARQLKASVFVAFICAFTFWISLVALHFSVLSLVRFFGSAFATTYAGSTWLSTIFVGLCSFTMCWTLLNLLVKADQPQRLPWKCVGTWLGFCVILLYNIIYAGIIARKSSFAYSDRFYLGYMVLSTVISSLFSTFRNDFQLSFSGSATQLGIFHSITGSFSFGRESVMSHSFWEAVRVVIITVLSGCIIGLSMNGLSSLLFLFDVSFHIPCLVIVFGQLFATKVMLKISRQLVMRPISFLLPSPFVVHTPTPEQTRTLTNVLESQDALLKLFAYTDLRRIAWTDRIRRTEVFSLSQPGGHPRNWTNISTTCVNVLEYIRSELEMASSRLPGGPSLKGGAGNLPDDDGAEVDREMLMMPMKSRKQLLISSIMFSSRLKKIQAFFGDEAHVVSRYDAHISVLAIESLYMFVIESYQEDRYGVVLKDLATIIGVFVQLIQTIDTYFRLKANTTVTTSSDITVRQIDAALQAGLLRIYRKFGVHFSALNLARDQLQTIKMVCQSD